MAGIRAKDTRTTQRETLLSAWEPSVNWFGRFNLGVFIRWLFSEPSAKKHYIRLSPNWKECGTTSSVSMFEPKASFPEVLCQQSTIPKAIPKVPPARRNHSRSCNFSPSILRQNMTFSQSAMVTEQYWWLGARRKWGSNILCEQKFWFALPFPSTYLSYM